MRRPKDHLHLEDFMREVATEDGLTTLAGSFGRERDPLRLEMPWWGSEERTTGGIS